LSINALLTLQTEPDSECPAPAPTAKNASRGTNHALPAKATRKIVAAAPERKRVRSDAV